MKFMNYINLKAHDTGENNRLSAKSYTKEFKELLQAVFSKQAYFDDFFAGGLEALDGIQHKDVAFSVKTSDIPCVIRKGTISDPAYDTDGNTAFGTGTGNSSRFGPRTEIIYTDTDVAYRWTWDIHEGIDRHTVNNDLESAVADRLDLQAQEKIDLFNGAHAQFISESAGRVFGVAYGITKENVGEIFNQLHKYYVNIGAKGTRVAKVSSDVYAAIVDTGLMTTSKGGTVSENDQTVQKFKGFLIEEIPEDLLVGSEVIYTYITGIGKAFTGIETARTIESEDFDGIALQGCGKAGEWVLPDNKAAIAKVKLGVAGPSITPATGEAIYEEYDASDFQTGLTVNGNKITGTLKYISTGTLTPGNYIALTFGSYEGNISAGIVPSETGIIERMADSPLILKVEDKDNQKIVIEGTAAGVPAVDTYDLSGLTLAGPA